ncbi:MAG: hypothetical protein PHG83_00220 [Patescibacteria group bacterium]|nr:hypothetical protein [Patescibacteria group bacterium]
MTINQNKINDQIIQNASNQLNDLSDKVNKINLEIDKTNKEANEKINNLDMEIDKSINNIKQICSDLDQIEKDAGDELDKLALQQAEDLASE